MTVAELMDALGQALQPLADEIPGLQVVPYLNTNPTPPSSTCTRATRSRQGPARASATRFLHDPRPRLDGRLGGGPEALAADARPR